ncbi:MAG: Tab2 family RNA-binding protein [Synechococcus sp.]
MIAADPPRSTPLDRQADWELDFYSRPILEPDGKKRWELLISSTPVLGQGEAFRYTRRCPANEVNSTWLTEALRDAMAAAEAEGWRAPQRLRSWRSAMRTMVQRAAAALELEMVPSRRTYALIDWMAERNREVYPLEEGYMAGPLAPPPAAVSPPAIPLPEAVRGDAWSWATLPLGTLVEAQDWPLGFNGLLPIPADLDPNQLISGLRLFSSTRALALAGWLGGLEPVRLRVDGRQLILDAGQDDSWLVTDLDAASAEAAQQALGQTRTTAAGLQFIAVQTTPDHPRFEGFWILRDQPEP